MVRARFPRLIEVLTVVLALVGGLLMAATLRDATPVADRAPEALWRLDLLLGAAACGLLPLRRRHPVAVFAAATAICVVSSTSNVAVLVALFAVSANRPAGTAGAAAVALWLANVAALALDGFVGDPLVSAVTVAGVIAGVAVWGRLARARHALAASATAQARSDERARIAREMHDILGHRISLISLQAGALEMQSGSAAPADINATAREAMGDLREVIGVLGADAPSGPQPALDDVPALVERSRAAGVPVDLTVDVPGPVPAALGRDAYRIVQEALTNVHKHAGSVPTQVEVHGRPGRGLHVRVRNADQRGQAPLIRGTGLAGLAERVAVNGGRLEHGHRRGEFVVDAELRWA